MEPLEPHGPLWKLLGKAKPVEPRPNFTQNVLRAARQTPQSRGWWARVTEWFQDNPSALSRSATGVMAAVALTVVLAAQFRTSDTPATMVAQPVLPTASIVAEAPLLAVESQLESVDEVSMLLALEDTSTLTDSEINFLLY